MQALRSALTLALALEGLQPDVAKPFQHKEPRELEKLGV